MKQQAIHSYENQYGLIGFRKAVNFNITTDSAITMIPGASGFSYRIDRITVTNPSISLTTAVGGIYTAASKGGVAVVSAAQVYSALTSAVAALDLTLAVTTNRTESALNFSLTVAQGAAATADIFIYGWVFDGN